MLVCRPYTSSDQDACLALIDAHIPAFFGIHERDDFAAYLEQIPRSFFLIEDEVAGAVVACGGIEVFAGGVPTEFRWVMVHPGRQGNGLGRYLMVRSMACLLMQEAVQTIAVRTSQHSAGFFRRLGFPARTVHVEPDYWAPGLELHVLHLDLQGAESKVLEQWMQTCMKQIGLRAEGACRMVSG